MPKTVTDGRFLHKGENTLHLMEADPKTTEKLNRFCGRLEEVMPFLTPIERILAGAVRDHWQENKPKEKL